MPIIIAVAASKGGTGKSTTAWALGSILSRDAPVLLFDADPQGTLTSAVAGEFRPERGAAAVLMRKLLLEDAIAAALPDYDERLHIVPASSLLSGIDASTAADIDRQYLLADVLATVANFSYIVIDTPAGQSVLTTAALVAADVLLSPAACQPAAFEALEEFEKVVGAVRRRLNPRLKLFIAPTLYDHRLVLDREVRAAIETRFGAKVLSPPVRRRVGIPEEMSARKPCSNPDYIALTQQFIERIKNENETIRAP